MAKAKPAKPIKLILKEGKQTTFWEAELKAKSLTTKWGRLYSTPKEKKQAFATPDKAKAALDKLVATKRAAGFRVLGELDAPQGVVARNAELEAAIREDREDPGPYLVYADWLQAQGSPLGEMIVLANAKKQKRVDAIAKQMGLPQPDLATCGWRLGFWQWLKLDNQVDSMDDTFDPIAFVKPLFASPLCAALEELRIGMIRWDYNDQPGIITEAGRNAWAKDLVRLAVGDVADDIDMDHHTIGDVGKVITKSFPRLKSLKLHSGSQTWRGGKETFGIGGLELPELEELVIETCAMSRKRIKSLLAAELPALHKLELWFGSADRGADAKVADVLPILDGLFPRVRHLGLRNSRLSIDIVRLLPSKKLAKQLEVLDLSMSTLNDEEAGELAGSAKAFPKLVTLDVDDNYLTGAGVRALRAAFKGAKVVSKDQRTSYDEDTERRYVSVEE